LRMAGARPRPLELLADTAASLADEDWIARLPEAERARVQAAAPRLVDACHRLAGLGLPDTLIHGDLHPWNIAVTDGGLVVFDWTDAGIGHPFLDLPVFLSETPDSGQRLAIREAVVTAWSGGWERAAVEEAADLALAIGSLNQADVYRLLLGHVEPWDHLWLHDADLRWLRAALSALDHGIDMRAD
jgi:Ser/Thr protein kinase RdoA (MazF antagonist)